MQPFQRTDEKIDHALSNITSSTQGTTPWWQMDDDMMVYYTTNSFGVWAKCNVCTEVIIGLSANAVLRIWSGYYFVVDGSNSPIELNDYICSEEGYFSTSTIRELFFTLDQVRKLKEISDVLKQRSSVPI